MLCSLLVCLGQEWCRSSISIVCSVSWFWACKHDRQQGNFSFFLKIISKIVKRASLVAEMQNRFGLLILIRTTSNLNIWWKKMISKKLEKYLFSFLMQGSEAMAAVFWTSDPWRGHEHLCVVDNSISSSCFVSAN